MTIKPPPLPGEEGWPSADQPELPPLEPMTPSWGRRYPWAWASMYGAVACLFLAGLWRFIYGWSPKEAWIVGAGVGFAIFLQTRWFANRPPWQPWTKKMPLFDIRRQPRWFPFLYFIVALPLAAIAVSRGIVDDRPFELLWGIGVFISGIVYVMWQRRYLDKIHSRQGTSL